MSILARNNQIVCIHTTAVSITNVTIACSIQVDCGQVHAMCISSQCRCIEGYQSTDTVTCVGTLNTFFFVSVLLITFIPDIDECRTMSCTTSTCVNLPGSYACCNGTLHLVTLILLIVVSVYEKTNFSIADQSDDFMIGTLLDDNLVIVVPQ